MKSPKTEPCIVLYLLVLLSFFINSGAYPNVFAPNNGTSPVSACILNIVQKYVPCNNLISVIISGSEYNREVIKTINDDECYTVILKSSNENNWLVWTETYVIIIVTPDDLSTILLDLSNDLHWNPQARFIIQTNETSKDTIKDLFKILLTRHIYNVVILQWNGDDVLIYTYFPFGEGKCGQSFEDVINVGICTEAVNTSLLFSNEQRDMKNCTVNIILHEDIPSVILESSNFTVFGQYVPGLEQYMLDTIGVRENITYVYKFMPDERIGSVYNNRTVTGIFLHLQTGAADIAVGGLILTKQRADVFGYIWGYNFVRISLYTPVSDSKSWKNVYKEFGTTTWILIGICYFLVSAIFIIIATLYPDMIKKRLMLLFILWSFFFQGNSDRSLLEQKRIRLLLCCWIWFTFFIANFYNTAMFSLATSQVQHKGVFVIDDLENLPFKPCIGDNMRNLFLSAYNQTLPKSVPLPQCQSLSDSLYEVATRRDLYSLGIKQNYKLREYEFTNSKRESTIDLWDFLNTCVTVLYVKRGYPLKDRMEKYARYMYEAGLLQHHFSILSLRSHSAIMRKSKSFVQVNLNTLKVHFFLLGIGIFISTVIFLCELVAPRILP